MGATIPGSTNLLDFFSGSTFLYCYSLKAKFEKEKKRFKHGAQIGTKQLYYEVFCLFPFQPVTGIVVTMPKSPFKGELLRKTRNNFKDFSPEPFMKFDKKASNKIDFLYVASELSTLPEIDFRFKLFILVFHSISSGFPVNC